MTFYDHLRRVASQALASIPASDARDAYAVSLQVPGLDQGHRGGQGEYHLSAAAGIIDSFAGT
jgi:hypothetical protein